MNESKSKIEKTVDPEVAEKDLNGDGHITKEEMEMNLEFKRKELEDADARRDAMRTMTWFALLGMLFYPTGILITAMLGQETAAKLIADMTQEFKEEEAKIMGDFGNDPVAKLKARELDLRAMDNEQKRMQAEQRLNLDKSRAMMNQDIQEEKLEQNEELAKLRANTSIEKTILGKTLPSSDKMPGNVAIIRKTGE